MISVGRQRPQCLQEHRPGDGDASDQKRVDRTPPTCFNCKLSAESVLRGERVSRGELAAPMRRRLRSGTTLQVHLAR